MHHRIETPESEAEVTCELVYKKIVDYRVLTATDKDSLTKQVVNLLNMNWELQGGICVSSAGVLFQAMVRYEN